MEKIALFHHSNPPLSHDSLATKTVRSNHTIFCVPTVSETVTERSASASHPPPSSSIKFSSYLCIKELKSLDSLKQMHAQIIKTTASEWNSDILAESLIRCYLELGDFRSASTVFLVGFSRNYLLWNSFLEEFEEAGMRSFRFLEIFGELHQKGLILSSRVLTFILKICAKLVISWLGMEIHAYSIKRGFDLDAHLNCALMNFYGRCWDAEYADKIFDEIPERNVLLWNEAIMVNSRSGSLTKTLQLFQEMQFSCLRVNSFTIAKVLQACGKLEALEKGKQIHGYVIRSSLESNLTICNSLISMYSKNYRPELARTVFDLMENRNITSWNSIISAYALNGYFNEAWQLFYELESSKMKPDLVSWNCLLSGHLLHGAYDAILVILQRMQVSGFKPNSSSITSVLQAITELGLLEMGKQIHGFVLRNGLEYDISVETTLLDMYVKTGSLTDAQAVFDNMKDRNVVAWNSLISRYSSEGYFEQALKLLNQMEQEGIQPDLITWNCLISGYSMRGHSKKALTLIRHVKTLGFNPNVVSWTALISGCSQNGNYRDSLEHFIQMQQEGIKPNSATISCAIQACAGLSWLQKGEEIHCLTIRNHFVEDIFVATALVDMYSKSGSLENAYKVFQNFQNKTLATWNSMIKGFAIYGRGKDAISLFKEMCATSIKPDAITFTALLTGCKNSGLIDEGWKFFDSMSTDYNLIPTIEHYSCMVDLLGRGGYLEEAWDFLQTMPLKPDASIWGALLGSCRIHKNLELAEICSNHLFKLEPHNPANYVLMMNLYAMENRWEEIEHLRDLMGAGGLKSSPGWCWMQIDQTIHVFSVEGRPHPDIGEIYFELYQLVSEMKKQGYVPDITCIYQNIDEEEKENILLGHPEKLAIAYGLIQTEKSVPIRVIKNSRVCADCHTAAKYISWMHQREIFLKDCVRFHHFKDGKCSCNNNW